MDIVDLQLAGTEIDIQFTDSATGNFILAGKDMLKVQTSNAEVGNW
jgi:hypothetical protein